MKYLIDPTIEATNTVHRLCTIYIHW